MAAAVPAAAQHHSPQVHQQGNTHITHNNIAGIRVLSLQYSDTLKALKRQYEHWHYSGADTLSNPYYFAIFSPGNIQAMPSRRAFSLRGKGGLQAGMPCVTQRVTNMLDAGARLLTEAYAAAPWLMQEEIPAAENLDTEKIGKKLKNEAAPKLKLADRMQDVSSDDKPVVSDADIVIKKPNFWTLKSNVSLQFTQYHVSDNWYKGGEKNYTMLAGIVAEANYDNKRKLQFDNKLEMKLGFQTSESDEEHKFKTTADQIRLTNQLGLKAIKNWSYTLSLQSWTQFYQGYKKNDTKVYSDFMSPFESLLSLGMTYKLNLKKFSANASINPISVHLKYVDRPSLITSMGLDEGKHSKWEYGSNITATFKWDVIKNVSWEGRIYWFSDYKKTLIEWENTFNFKVNRFLSAKLFVYPRFDDSVDRKEPDDSFFQFNEIFSLGVNIDF